jgi:hypothetical protein
LKVGRDGVEKVRQDVFKKHSELVKRIRAGEDLTGDLARAANELNSLYQKALAVCNIFWEKYPPNKYMKTISREERKECFAPQGTVPCVWIADWIVEDERDGSVWIRDAKTTSEDFSAIMVGFLYSVQCRFYRLMSAQEKWGDRVKGFIVDMLKMPSIKLCGKDEKMAAKLGCTPMEAYIQRVKEWYEANEETPMDSRAIVFNEDLHNPEIMSGLDTVIDLWGREPKPELFSKDITTSKCHSNRRTCPYYTLCNSDPAGWPSLIEQYYEIRELPERKKNEKVSKDSRADSNSDD